jgi:ribosomal protein S18 acetylase RimI-like enzyme
MTFLSDPDAQLMGLFWTLRLDEPLPAAVEPGIAAIFAQAGPDDIAELAAAMGLDDTLPVLQRFERGCRCYLVRANGQLVSYGWVTFDEERIGSLGLSVRLQPGEAYIWDCATLAVYRGQRLYPALLTYMQHALRAAGFQRIWIGMDADNLPSQAGVARAGFQQIVALLQASNTPTRTFFIRADPGASQQDVQAAQYALLGDREASSITLP